MDRAGQNYWNEVWDRKPSPVFNPHSGALRDYRDKAIARLVDRALAPLARGATVLEAGCADSILLPYIARQGFRIAGIDYSPIGCEQARERLAGLQPKIECADIFGATELRGDLVVSLGLVEHFDDTASVVRAIARLTNPTGRVLTIIPNMRGLVGLAQRLIAPSVYAVHVPVSLERLRAAHEAAGLHVQESDYLLASGFNVVNPHEPRSSPMALKLRVFAYLVLARLSRYSWYLDAHLPRSELLSPYCYCLAEKVHTG